MEVKEREKGRREVIKERRREGWKEAGTSGKKIEFVHSHIIFCSSSSVPLLRREDYFCNRSITDTNPLANYSTAVFGLNGRIRAAISIRLTRLKHKGLSY